MRFLLLILAIGIILLILWQRNKSKTSSNMKQVSWGGASQAQLATTVTEDDIAYISRGNLYLSRSGEASKQHHSPYVQKLMDRAEKRKEMHGWKENTSFSMSHTGKVTSFQSDNISVKFTSAQYLSADKLVYFLQDDDFGGLFEFDLSNMEEKRLFHKQNVSFEDLRANRTEEKIAFSDLSSNGIANICTVTADGDGFRELTGGDTLDTSPDWVPGKQQIVFQSSGIARDNNGYLIAYGPSSIQLLDLDNTEITTVLEDSRYEYISPRVDSLGNLYYIQRPYEAPRHGFDDVLTSALLFPFRLARAIFHYLNFFSMTYSQKPLTSASGHKVDMDMQNMLIQNRRINAEKAMRKGLRINGVPSLVPKSWELVKLDRNGDKTTLATSVASFDIGSNDSLYYSNGYGIFNLISYKTVVEKKLISNIMVS